MVLVFTPLARLVSRKREKASSADSLDTMEIFAFFLMTVTPLGSCEIYQKPSAAAKIGKTPETLRDSSVFPLLVGVAGFEPAASWTRIKSHLFNIVLLRSKSVDFMRISWYHCVVKFCTVVYLLISLFTQVFTFRRQ